MRVFTKFIALSMTAFFVESSWAANSPLLGPDGFAFGGKWMCSGRIPGQDKDRVHRALYEGRMVSNGSWIELTQKDLEPGGYDATFLFGYDSNKKEVVNFIGDNKGFATMTSPGWKGHSITLTVEKASYPEPVPASRVTYQYKSPDQFSLVWESREGGKWTPDDALDCVRP